MKKMIELTNGKYIVVEGNIGAGKTSFSQLLASELNACLILEEFSNNPFLPLFYKNSERYAFPVELFFMTERHQQLQSLLLKQDLFQNYTVSDYIFSKTLLFAEKTLKGEELGLFQRLFDTLNASFPKPDLLVYLHRPVSELLKNIQLRNRSYEQNISANYLEQIQRAYFDFFNSQCDQLPTLILNVEGMDFVHNKEDYNQLIKTLQKPYKNGVHWWNKDISQ